MSSQSSMKKITKWYTDKVVSPVLRRAPNTFVAMFVMLTLGLPISFGLVYQFLNPGSPKTKTQKPGKRKEKVKKLS